MNNPCKNCITFSICKAKKFTIQCDFLDKYLSYKGVSEKVLDKRKIELEKLFNKEILHVSMYYRSGENIDYKVVVWWLIDEYPSM